ncbi:MAG: FAD-binding oxidoreductase [Clostridiales bacterium]|nr:FAD-binding oxidoreductase [Clostridiales bacterium]
MKRIRLNQNDDTYSDYLMDASLLQGHAEELVFCHTTKEVKVLLDECYMNQKPLTIQGAMTGICGGGVPGGGCILNLSEMNDVKGMSYNETSDTFSIKVAPGLLLKDLNNLLLSQKINTSNWTDEDKRTYESFIKAKPKFFPPDPTEVMASIGGMVACDASGACSFKYGSTRDYVESIKVVILIEGVSEVVTIKRGHYTYKEINTLFHCDMPLPRWRVHNKYLKDVAGLYYTDDMDLVDLFIGSEGLFGVITEVELKLINTPEIKMGLMLFLDKTDKMIDFINWLRGDNISDIESLTEKPCAIEYFDKHTFEMLNDFRDLKTEISQLPSISDLHQGGLYLEFHLNEEALLDDVMAQLFDSLNTFGINEAEQWLALESSDYDKLKNFRHSVPECVNILVANQKLIEPTINKIGTDMAVPNEALHDVLTMYQTDSKNKKIKTFVFGHIGDNHLHVNIIPKDYNEYSMSLDLVKAWGNQVIKWRGTVTAEHGIGKLKKELLKQMMTHRDIESMKTIKKIIEPSGLINQGTLLD